MLILIWQVIDLLNNQIGFKLRVRYQKISRLRYLSHLEVLRAIERSIRRAELPFALTQGFSPHMKIAYSAALPLGAESLDEYFDVNLTDFVDTKEALKRLQDNSPENLYPLDAKYIDPKSDSLTKALTISEYEISLSSPQLSPEHIQLALDEILNRNYIEFDKKGKIKKLELQTRLYKKPQLTTIDTGKYQLNLITRALDSGSLRPDILIDALAREIEITAPDVALCTRVIKFKDLGLDLRFDRFRVFESVLIKRTAQYIEEVTGELKRGI